MKETIEELANILKEVHKIEGRLLNVRTALQSELAKSTVADIVIKAGEVKSDLVKLMDTLSIEYLKKKGG